MTWSYPFLGFSVAIGPVKPQWLTAVHEIEHQVIQWCFKNFGDKQPLFLSRWPLPQYLGAKRGMEVPRRRSGWRFFLGASDSGEHPNDLLYPWFLLVEYQWLSPLRLVKLQGPSWNEESRRFCVFFCYGLKMIYSLQNTCRASKISGLKPRFCGLGGEDWPRFFFRSETPVVLDTKNPQSSPPNMAAVAEPAPAQGFHLNLTTYWGLSKKNRALGWEQLLKT